MAKYREVEEAWERQQEEKGANKKIAAAMKKVEEEVKVGRTTGPVRSSEHSTIPLLITPKITTYPSPRFLKLFEPFSGGIHLCLLSPSTRFQVNRFAG